MTPVSIVKMLKAMKSETKAIINQVMTICWYMRSMGLNEAYNLNPTEREVIMKIIDENIERTKKSGMPLL